jgi:glycosyltransferase involved in cell wall biosynthesis
MKVFHFHFGKEGGAERFFVSLINSFAERGVEQTAFVRPDRLWRPEIDPRIVVHEKVWRRISLSRFFLEAKLKRLIQHQKPDALMAWMPRGARFTPNYPGAIKLARLGDYPLRLDYFTNIDVLVCNTPGIAERVRELGWKRRVEVISNFTNIKTAPPISRERVNTPANAFVVLGVGRFVRRKGFHTLIEAIDGLPDTYIWLVGNGEEHENLRNEAQNLGVLDRVRFLGWQKNPAPYLAACDVFCMPSTHEPLGNVILEAWGSGKPVVASRSEGPTWFMRDERDGLLFDIEDAKQLRDALQRLRTNPQLMQQIMKGGRATLDAQFSKQSVTDAYLQLFASGPNARSEGAGKAVALS